MLNEKQKAKVKAVKKILQRKIPFSNRWWGTIPFKKEGTNVKYDERSS